ncbi:hypothetical protein AWB68_05605 [Caballeronia choica]|uniref:Uncharacterized protein n=2 Tax=Caballeronia choica TaxID=326476 RepID=A0A158KFS9_9BURK|nr:hypothetical protein AWB68_05605 [Caballeronia choica]
MHRWRSLLFSCCLVTNTATAASLDERDGVRVAAIQAAAANARFASKFCMLPPAKLFAYKAMVRARLGDPPGFESDWEQGWWREQETIAGYEKLRAEKPNLFASDVRAACAELIALPR